MKTSWLLLLILCVAPASWCRAADYTLVLSLGGGTNLYVQEFSNLGSENEVVEHKIIVGGQEIVRKIPGRLKWLDVTLKRGLSKSFDFAGWRKQVESGHVDAARRNVSIIIYDQALNPIARWEVENAWPSALTLEQKPDGTFVEVLRLVHEGMLRVEP